MNQDEEDDASGPLLSSRSLPNLSLLSSSLCDQEQEQDLDADLDVDDLPSEPPASPPSSFLSSSRTPSPVDFRHTTPKTRRRTSSDLVHERQLHEDDPSGLPIDLLRALETPRPGARGGSDYLSGPVGEEEDHDEVLRLRFHILRDHDERERGDNASGSWSIHSAPAEFESHDLEISESPVAERLPGTPAVSVSRRSQSIGGEGGWEKGFVRLPFSLYEYLQVGFYFSVVLLMVRRTDAREVE